MKCVFLSKFGRDLDKIKNKDTKSRISSSILEIEQAAEITEIKNIKKLKGDKISYRIRIGDYRLGIFYEKGIVEFARILHRKDIYKVFP